MVPYHAAWRLLPRKYRAMDTTLLEPDRDEHGASPATTSATTTGFGCGSDFWPGRPDDRVPHGDEFAADLSPDTVSEARRNRLARALTPSWFAGRPYFGITHSAPTTRTT